MTYRELLEELEELSDEELDMEVQAYNFGEGSINAVVELVTINGNGIALSVDF